MQNLVSKLYKEDKSDYVHAEYEATSDVSRVNTILQKIDENPEFGTNKTYDYDLFKISEADQESEHELPYTLNSNQSTPTFNCYKVRPRFNYQSHRPMMEGKNPALHNSLSTSDQFQVSTTSSQR